MQFIIRNDKNNLFLFSALQSNFAQQFLSGWKPEFDEMNEKSILLYYKGKKYSKSDAVIRIMKLLGGGYYLFSVCNLIPKFIRDGAYELFSRYRYRMFGKQEFCMIPDEAVKSKFLE